MPIDSFHIHNIFLSRYNISILLATYLIPMATLTVTYTRIGVELWGQQTIGENTPVQFERIKSKRRVSLVVIHIYQ